MKTGNIISYFDVDSRQSLISGHLVMPVLIGAREERNRSFANPRINDGGSTSNAATGAAIALELVHMRFALGRGCGAILT